MAAPNHIERQPAPHEAESAQTPISAPPAAPLPPPPAVKPLRIEERYFNLREIRQNEWHAIVPAKATLIEIMKPETWANIARKLKPFDKIVVVKEDRTLYVELIVVSTGLGRAEMRVFGLPIEVSIDAAARSAAVDYEVVDLGEIKHWGVRRVSDGREVKGDGTCLTRDQAERWLSEYLRQEARRVA